MTTERFRQLVKRLHPDLNGGAFGRGVRSAWENILAHRQRHRNRLPKCSCGVVINPTAKHCGICARKLRRERLALAASLWLLAIAYCLFAPGALAQPRPKTLAIPAAVPTNAPVVETYHVALAWNYDSNTPPWTVIQWYTNGASGQIHQFIQPATLGTNRFSTNLAVGDWTFVVWSSDGKTSSTSQSIDVTPLRRMVVTLTDFVTQSNRVIYSGAPMPGPGGRFTAWKDIVAIKKP